MNSTFSIFVVDDTEISREILYDALGETYHVEAFDSGEACVTRLAEKVPDLFLLDVDMPGMNGYELSRHIRCQDFGKDVSIIFVSGCDDHESRLEAYDAGGDDFVAKPFQIPELERKIASIVRGLSTKSALQQQASDSDTLTTLVLSNLDEYAVLVKFLRSLNSCETYNDIAQQVMWMMTAYHLEGALQFRLPNFEITLSHSGEVRPLEAAIINHVRTSDTIVQFGNRAAYNFEYVSILISNMPVANADLCGRLRDHLAIAVETVNMKLQSMSIKQKSSNTKDEIAKLTDALMSTVSAFKARYEDARYKGSVTTQAMLNRLSGQLAILAMTDAQEAAITDSVRDSAYALVDTFDFGKETEKALSNTVERLKATLAAA